MKIGYRCPCFWQGALIWKGSWQVGWKKSNKQNWCLKILYFIQLKKDFMFSTPCFCLVICVQWQSCEKVIDSNILMFVADGRFYWSTQLCLQLYSRKYPHSKDFSFESSQSKWRITLAVFPLFFSQAISFKSEGQLWQDQREGCPDVLSLFESWKNSQVKKSEEGLYLRRRLFKSASLSHL